MKNVFTRFLQALDVPHTVAYSDRYYREYPYKNSLYGLSRMLLDYGVDNLALRLERDESELSELEAPFIAFANNEFVLVEELSSAHVVYCWRGKSIKLTVDDFLKTWSGVVLLAEKTGRSKEPQYREHLKAEWFDKGEKTALFVILLSLLFVSFFVDRPQSSVYLAFSSILNQAGLYVSWLLLLKQIGIQTEFGDKVCSLWKKSSCNDVLSTPAAKLFGIIGLSEIGMSYFISNLLVLHCADPLTGYYAWISIMTLPFTVWSFCYQKFKIRIWCPLCLVVLGILWMNFLVNFLHGIPMVDITGLNLLFAGSLYLLPLLAINLLCRIFYGNSKMEDAQYKLNSLIANKDVFNALLQKSEKYLVDKSVSSVCWGNKEASDMITVITNPHCDPCAALHRKLERFLERGGDRFCIQYVFTSFNEELSISAKFLIWAYAKNEEAVFLAILDRWYKEGKYRRESFFQEYGLELDRQVEDEYARHYDFAMKNKIRSTPTILFNGYKKPEEYMLEDLLYIV